MGTPITQILYDWMVERRIVSLVARKMGTNPATLSAELRTKSTHAKLGANDLVPLCNAIREAGLGRQLDGLLHPFVEELMGDLPDAVNAEEYVSSVLSLSRCVGLLSESATRVNQIEDEQELTRLRTMIRTELLTLTMRMDAIVDTQLARLNEGRKRSWISEVMLRARPARG